MSYPARAEGLGKYVYTRLSSDVDGNSLESSLYGFAKWVDSNTCNHIIEYKILIFDTNTWNLIIVYKLLIFDRNTWNYIIVYK